MGPLVGCIHYTSEHRTFDYPGSEGCDKDQDFEDCGPDCPGYEEPMDPANESRAI